MFPPSCLLEALSEPPVCWCVSHRGDAPGRQVSESVRVREGVLLGVCTCECVRLFPVHFAGFCQLPTSPRPPCRGSGVPQLLRFEAQREPGPPPPRLPHLAASITRPGGSLGLTPALAPAARSGAGSGCAHSLCRSPYPVCRRGWLPSASCPRRPSGCGPVRVRDQAQNKKATPSPSAPACGWQLSSCAPLTPAPVCSSRYCLRGKPRIGRSTPPRTGLCCPAGGRPTGSSLCTTPRRHRPGPGSEPSPRLPCWGRLALPSPLTDDVPPGLRLGVHWDRGQLSPFMSGQR